MGKYSFNFDYLAKQLDEIINVRDGKSISSSDVFLKQDLESILVSAYDFNEDIPESKKQFIIQSGIGNFIRKSIKDGKQLKNQIKRSENDFLKLPLKRFIILSSLSIPYFAKLPNIRLLNGYVSFHSFYPKKFKLAPIRKQLLSYSNSIPPHNYVAVKVHINARNSSEAVTRGLELMDLIRGIWNFSINRRVPTRIKWGADYPINKIRYGPTYTLHDTNGNLVTELFWGDINFQEKSSIWNVKHKWEYISKEFVWIKNVLNKIKYKDDLIQMFVRYTNALDTNDYESSYLKLWSLLEFLTDTINSNYDKTISRSLFIYKDDIISRQIIEHLRIFRNRVVHFGETRDELDPLLFQIKRFVEINIWLHLKLAGEFNSLEDFGKFLDLPKSKESILNEIEYRKKAINFLYS